MRALALGLSLMLAGPSWADPPADAPLADAVVLTPAEAIAAAARIRACEAERAALVRQFPASPWWVVMTVAVASVGAGVGLGFGLAKLAK